MGTCLCSRMSSIRELSAHARQLPINLRPLTTAAPACSSFCYRSQTHHTARHTELQRCMLTTGWLLVRQVPHAQHAVAQPCSGRRTRPEGLASFMCRHRNMAACHVNGRCRLSKGLVQVQRAPHGSVSCQWQVQSHKRLRLCAESDPWQRLMSMAGASLTKGPPLDCARRWPDAKLLHLHAKYYREPLLHK